MFDLSVRACSITGRLEEAARFSLSKWGGAALCGSAILLSPLGLRAAESTGWCTVSPSAAPRGAVAAAVREAQPHLNDQPHPLLSVHKQTYEQGKGDDIIIALHELALMRSAAVAWYAGAGDEYFDMANRYLLGWITVYPPDYQPIDEMHFDALIDTYAIIRNHMDPAAQAKVATALRDWGNGYISRMAAHPEGREHETDIWNNNFQSFRLQLLTMMAVALQDKAMFEKARQLYWTHLAINMKPDGSVLDWYQRDALYYVRYNLEALLKAALAARSWGDGREDWYHRPAANGASLEKGMQWLVPYVNGEKTHQEFDRSVVPQDLEHRALGLKGTSGPFDTKTAANTFWFAAQFDPHYLSLAQSLGNRPPFLGICGH